MTGLNQRDSNTVFQYQVLKCSEFSLVSEVKFMFINLFKENLFEEHSKYNNWCCHFSNVATKAQSICKVQKFRS